MILFAIAGFALQAQAQDVNNKNVPAAVITAFNSNHSGVTDVEWKKDGANYEVSYDLPNKKDIYITYDASGKLIRTKEEISDKDLPSAIMAYIQKNYDEDEARNAFKVTDADGTLTYKVKMKGDHLIFDSNGAHIKTVKADKKRSS